MFYGLALLLLMDSSGGVNLHPLTAGDRPTHFVNYTHAYREAQRSKKPLLVVLNPNADADEVPVHLPDVRKTQHRRTLLERFVVVEIDTSTVHGETVHQLFENKPLPHVAVIDRDQKWMVFRTSRKLQGEDWNRILETFQNGESTASLNLDARPACPT
jgi:hypothetical protein